MNDALVLTYHGVAREVVEPWVQVTLDVLRRQVGWLQEAGFSFVTAQELCEAVFGGSKNKLVALTFDDGYSDFSELAWPCLQELGVGAATVFLCPDHTGRYNDWNFRSKVRFRHMDLDELRRLRDAGVELAPHGREHRNFLQLSPERLEADLDYCRDWFHRYLEIRPRLLAYPYGDFREDQLDVVAHRFDYAFSVCQGRGFRDRHAISRRNVGQDTRRETLLGPIELGSPEHPSGSP
jgi:peptidoglycan/xylan/chitin deacetylase (PgdA/CDA1 family)